MGFGAAGFRPDTLFRAPWRLTSARCRIGQTPATLTTCHRLTVCSGAGPTTVSTPSVSVGVPVYNGERYLPAALDAALGQPYDDFELIVCDNASTDQTASICRAYAARDSRIRYFRTDVNIGPNPNFNRTLQLARAPLFKWAAHDDLVAPDHLRACVTQLQETPDAVLCQSHVIVIDLEDKELGIYDGGLANTDSA